MLRTKRPVFNDGVVQIFGVSNLSASGDLPREGLREKVRLRFHRRTVGVQRYYTSMQAGEQVDAVLRCPALDGICPTDVAILDGRQYRITLVQRPENTEIPVMDLTLRRLEQDYDLG